MENRQGNGRRSRVVGRALGSVSVGLRGVDSLGRGLGGLEGWIRWVVDSERFGDLVGEAVNDIISPAKLIVIACRGCCE